MLALTKSGYKEIGKRPKIEKPDNVSNEHFFWQQKLYRLFRDKECLTWIEKSLNGKRADVFAIIKDKKNAFEIEMTPNNAVSNVVVDLEAGFDKVISCCKNSVVLREVKKRLSAYKDYERIKDKVEVRLLADFNFQD